MIGHMTVQYALLLSGIFVGLAVVLGGIGLTLEVLSARRYARAHGLSHRNTPTDVDTNENQQPSGQGGNQQVHNGIS